MLIDWFTVIAQVLNFLILIWLLKRFLYKPILKAIDQRDEKIKSQLREAENKMADAQKEKDDYLEKKASFDAQRQSMVKKAADEADAQRKQLLEEARKEAKDLRSRLEQSLAEERQNLHREIMDRTQKEIFAIARKALTDLASANLEEHMVRIFIDRLKGLEGAEKEAWTKAFQAGPREVLVRSTFELPPEQRAELESTLKDLTDGTPTPRFETAPEQISGIELSADGYKVAWSIAEYLQVLENKLNELLNKEREDSSKTTSKQTADESTQ